MKSKLTAVLAVAAFLIAGIAVVAAEPADGDIPLGTVYVGSTDSEGQSVLLKFNESAYSGYEDYTIDMDVSVEQKNANIFDDTKKASPTTTSGTVNVGTESAAENIKFSVEPVGADAAVSGNYSIKVTTSGVEAGTYAATVYLIVKVNPVAGTEIELTALSYTISINVTDGQSDVKFPVEEFTAGQDMEKPLTVSDGSGSFPYMDYSWYAVGLPEGLNIITKGGVPYIAGLTNFDDSMDDDRDGTAEYEVKVNGRDANGSEVTGTITLAVNKEAGMSYMLWANTTWSVALDNNSVDAWVSKSSSDPVYLTVENADVSKVTVISMGDGIRADATTGNASGKGYWEIPVGGAGVYTIEIDYEGGTEVVSLHVVPLATGAGAGFIVIGNP